MMRLDPTMQAGKIMANQETEEISSNIEKKSAGDTSQEQAQESTSREAQSSFSAGQGKAASDARERDSQNEVTKGALPQLKLFGDSQSFSAQMHARKKADDIEPPGHAEQQNNVEPRDHGKHGHDHGKPRQAGEQGEPQEPRETIDPNASHKFRHEVRQAKGQVLQAMPEHLRQLLKDVPVNPVRSITHNESGDKINGTHGPDGINLSEVREGNAPLDTILKHEYGHAFDETADPPYSQDPEYRKKIDDAIKNDPELKRMRDEDPDGFYAEMFADLFGSNLGARGRDLTLPYADRLFASAREWVKGKMMAGARTKK